MSTLPVRCPAIRLSNTSTRSFALTMMPDPAGTEATAEPGAPKFGVLLSRTSLSNTRVLCPACGRSGMLKTRMPPVFRVATLPCTSAPTVFSISIPATFHSARLLRTMTLRDWPT